MTTLAGELHRTFLLLTFCVAITLQRFDYLIDIQFIIPLFVIIKE